MKEMMTPKGIVSALDSQDKMPAILSAGEKTQILIHRMSALI